MLNIADESVTTRYWSTYHRIYSK